MLIFKLKQKQKQKEYKGIGKNDPFKREGQKELRETTFESTVCQIYLKKGLQQSSRHPKDQGKV